MRTTEQQVYKFSELAKDVQEKVIEKYYENEDYPFLNEDLLEELNQLDTLKIFSNVKLQYSLAYCQGDGLSFSADINILNWLKNRNMKVSVVDAVYNNIYPIKCLGNQGRYAYAKKQHVCIEKENIRKYKRLDVLIDTIEEELQDYYMDICRKLEKHGYSILEYRMDTDEFSEYAEANEYFINGKQF